MKLGVLNRWRQIGALVGVVMVAMLASCGGGAVPSHDGAAVANPLGGRTAQVAAPEVAVDLGRSRALGVVLTTPNASADQLLNWAEINFPQFFPSHSTTLTEGPWVYRSYMQTGVLIGINAGEVYVTGGQFGGQLLKVGKVSDFVKPPIAVKRSSYENKMEAGLVFGPVELPVVNDGPGLSLWSAHALGDFFQDGTYSLFALSMSFLGADGKPATTPGRAHLFQLVNGTWVDRTSTMLDSDAGCIGAHRLLVADFNGDGRPDVLASCSGIDTLSGIQPGEHPRLFLSQPDGRYKNTTWPALCFCVGAATIDTRGDGFSDIVFKDNAITSDLLYYVNNRDGTFSLDQSRVPQSARVFGNHWSRAIYDVHLVDAWGTGRYDLILAGVDWPCTPSASDDCGSNWRTTIFRNDGRNRWSDADKVMLPTPPGDYGDVYDVIVYRGNVYQLRTAPKGHAVQRVNLATMESKFVWEYRDYLRFAFYTIQTLIVYSGKIVPLEKLPIEIDP